MTFGPLWIIARVIGARVYKKYPDAERAVKRDLVGLNAPSGDLPSKAFVNSQALDAEPVVWGECLGNIH
jgi:hypothetical protein